MSWLTELEGFSLTRLSGIIWLKGLDESLAAGLPLETGLKAAVAIERVEKVPTEQLRQFLKVGAEALRPLTEALRAFSTPPSGGKTQVALDIPEPKREPHLIEWYLEHGQVDNALRLMREWVVNRVMLARGEINWLDISTRGRWERPLPCLQQALDAAGKADLLPVEQGGSEPNDVFISGDPHTGYSEIGRIRNDPRWHDIALCCERIICNVTGGTTVLQWCVSALVDQASRFGIPVRKVAMVDRRSHDEQQEPFVLREMITLHDQTGAAASEGDGKEDG